MSKWMIAVAAAAALASPAVAQHEHEAPYAELEQREIKALSPDEIAELRAGQGMGFALAAELNHHPGPRHVLDLAAELVLSNEQVAAVRGIQTRMRSAAVAVGERIIERERALDRAFATGDIDRERLRRLTGEIGSLRGELRAVHLEAHLEVTALLTPEQIVHYDRLRGYGG